ncbi:MAG: DUF2799 domain-containing protein [Pseudomonadota bacterium]
MSKKNLITLFLLIGLQACSSSPKTPSDYWMGQGERVGAAGYAYKNIVIENLKTNVPFDEEAYKKGYESGKRKYCDPFKAFEKGMQGVKYTGQCLEYPQEAMIKAEWQRGWDAFIGADFYRQR